MTRGGILSSTKGLVISAPFHWPPKDVCAVLLHEGCNHSSPKIGRESLSFAGCFAIAAYAKGLMRPAGEARDTQQGAQTLW